jgi:DNA replication factor GINS
MDLDDLRGVQAGERSTDSLQSLSDSFYRDVVDYIEGLREERSRAAERADDPFGSEEVRRLTDEIETAQEVAEAIYDRRIGKVVKRASLAAAGMPADEEGLTDEEARLFSDLVEQIESHRGSVLSAFAGEGSIETATSGEATREATRTAGEPDRSAGEPTAPVRESSPDEDRVDPEPAPEPTGGEFDASAAMGGDAAPGDRRGEEVPPTDGTAPEEPPTGDAPPSEDGQDEWEFGTETDNGREGSGTPGRDERKSSVEDAPESSDATEIGRTTVRITRDVGEIMGVDEHVYELATEDVVTLPQANAEPLLERDAASRID